MNLAIITDHTGTAESGIPLAADFAWVRLPGGALHIFHGDAENKNSGRFFMAPYLASEDKDDYEISAIEHAQLVTDACEQIRNGKLEKVVVSRQKKLSINKSAEDWKKTFAALCVKYPRACIMWTRSGEEMWIAATPELLLKKRGNTYSTIALAGTREIAAEGITGINWGEKEKHEQELVTGYILDKLKSTGATDFRVDGPHTIAAGPVAHLQTGISFCSDVSLQEIIAILHPTPAVCGLPLDSAREFIQLHEPHQRDNYTGYFGIELPNGDCEVFVTLRCMRIIDDVVTLFAGGGIVEGSDPSSEWEETERKLETLLPLLR